MGSHAELGGRELGAGGARCASLTNSLPYRRAERSVSRRGAEGRCPFRRRLRACARALRGVTPVEARRVAGTLLPDLLYYDPTRPASYPDNGRTPSDDAPGAFLAVITNGKVTGDGIGPHDDLLAEFPYLGPPHNGSR